jgi:hypothetical protein
MIMPRFDYDFYMPSTKRELVVYLNKVYPDCKWAKMPKAQLMAIYCKVRRAEECFQ